MTANRALRRIQVIVALVMILSMLAGSPAAQAAPLAPRPAAAISQLANGGVGQPVQCANWVTGNLGSNKAHYAEGDSVPYQYHLTNLSVGPEHALTIAWDTTKSGKHAFDYLTTFNRTVACADPLAGTGLSAGTPSSTFPIPVDPDVAGAGITQIPGVFTLYNGTITGVSSYSMESGTYASDSTRKITVYFTVSSANAVLTFGGHIGSRLDWGIGGSASAIQGSPYHMRLLGLDGKGGNQDLSLSAAAVYYHGLEIDKSGTSLSKIGDVVTYTFTITNVSDSDSPELVKQSITDDVLGTIGSGQCTSLASGQSCTFSVVTTVPPTASDPLVNTVTAVYTPTNSSQVVTASDSHSLNLFQPSIDVEKTGPATASVGSTIEYTVRITNTSSADSPALELDSLTDSLKGDVKSLASGCGLLAPGASCSFTYSYEVPQGSADPLLNTVSALYHPMGFPNDITGSDSHSVDLLFGGLSVTKVVNWNGVTPNTAQIFEICINGPSYPSGNCKTADYDGATLTWSNLIPGTYTVTETNPGTQWTVSGSGVAVTVGTGGGASHTVTNTRKLGSLDVTKIVDWEGMTPQTGQTFEICISGPSYPSGNCKTVGYNGGSVTWSNLIPGDYTVTETDPGARWSVVGSGVTATVPTNGGGAQATITNTYVPVPGSIRVVKVTDPTGNTTEFPFTFGTTPFALQDGEDELFSDLQPGTYLITETVPAGWELTDVTCVEAEAGASVALPSFNYTATGVGVTLGEGDDVVCTFTNTKLPDPTYGIAGHKWEDLDGDGLQDPGEARLDGWTIRLWQNGSVISTTITSDEGYYSFSDLPAGTYSVTEVLEAGWEQTFPAGGSHDVVLPDDETGDGIAGGKDFGNRRLGGLEVEKRVVGGSGTFEICIVGPSYSTANCQSTSGGTVSWSNLIPGAYTVSETDPGVRWTVDVVPSQVSVATGMTATAVITNTYVPELGSIRVVKVTEPTGATQAFDFAFDDTDFALKDGESRLFSGLSAGGYAITETVPAGWELVDVTCVEAQPQATASAVIDLPAFAYAGSSASVELGEGDHVVCTFTNEKLPDPTYTISGSKWNDLNENGLWDGDPTEPGLEDWTIQLWQDGAVIATTTTAADGSYAFSTLPAGTYSVTEVLQGGWTQTFPESGAHEVTLPFDSQDGSASGLNFGNFRNLDVVTYSLSGAKWNDVDADGVWDDGEAGLAGWEITLTRGDLVLKTTTAADGSYHFDNLEPGAYTVAETQQSGWTQTFPTGDGKHAVTIVDADVDDVNFGNTVPEVPTYSLSGVKWNDVDGDGARDAGEPTLAGWTIQLRNAEGDLIATDVTDESGAYSFTDLEAGTYTVSEVQQSGWTQTFPTGDGTHAVTITEADVTGKDFGNHVPEAPTYSLSGAKWNDLNGDGAWQQGSEPTLAGWTIQLRNAAGNVIATAVTDANGAYAFTGLAAGTYTVSEVQQEGWTQTFPTGDGRHQVTISNADVTNLNFGNEFTFEAASYSISGFKWNDGNENAVWDAGEPGIGGWTIQLLDGQGNVIASTTTDASGAYRFDNLEPGTYTVAEVQQEGWTQTFPSSGGTHAVVLSEASVTGVNFGNYRPMEQPPTPVPCTRADVAVVIFGGWNDIAVKAWVGGTEQETLYTAADAFGQQQVMWTFYPPANTSWNVTVQPQTPDGMDPARWQYRLVRIESPSQGTENNNPGSPSVSITRCNQYVLYFQLVDTGTTPVVAPTPPSEPGLPVTGGGPEPLLAGGAGLFAALSGLGWIIRRRR